jgi:hypothetical protein
VSEREGLPDDEPGLPNLEVLIKQAQAHQSRNAPPAAGEAAPPEPAPATADDPHRADAAAATTAAAPAAVARPPEGPPKPLSPTRAMALYLTQIRSLLAEASESRRAWVRQIGIMMQDARTRPLAMVSPAAGKIGSEQMSRFGELRERLAKLEPPPGCGDLHALFNGWLDRHTEVCQILVDFGRSGDLAKLRTSQSLLAEGRSELQRFQAEYTRRVTALKKQVDAAKKRRRTKWPFGRPKA